jgi:hypothetical protein
MRFGSLHRKKNHKTKFQTNSMLKDKIEKKKLILKKNPRKKNSQNND